jgi:hypothetical protein
MPKKLPPGALTLIRTCIGPDFTATPIPGGQHATFHILGAVEAILKVFPAQYRGFDVEQTALELIRAGLAGVLPVVVPEVYGSASDADGRYLLLSFFLSRSLAQAIRVPEFRRRPALVQAAESIGRIHSIASTLAETATRTFPVDGLAGLVRVGQLDFDGLCERVRQGACVVGAERTAGAIQALEAHRAILEGVCAPIHLVHGDYQPKNLLITRHGEALVAVIDWELACLSSPIRDLATLLRFCDDLSTEDAVLDAYPALPWTHEMTRVGARCFDLARVAIGMSTVRSTTSDTPAWLEFVDATIAYLAAGAPERLRRAAAALILFGSSSS